MLKHYVEFFYTGKFPVGPEEEEISERNPKLVKLPKGACGYRFFDREENDIDGETVKDEPYKYSPYVFFGKMLTRRDVKKLEGRKSLFYKFMKENGYQRAVLTKDGNIICVEEDDQIIITLK